MKKIFYLILLFSTPIFAQEELNFDKRFIDCEDRWVAVKQNSVNTYLYGYVFMEDGVGLNISIEGTFSILNDGEFVPLKSVSGKRKIMKLEPDNQQVAVIPEEKYSELQIVEKPDWLGKYKVKITAQSLYRSAFVYNKWKSCYNALVFLKLAEQKKAKFKEFYSEIAYSYNCLGLFENAAEIAEKGRKRFPDDALLNRELIFAQAEAGFADDAAKSCKKAFIKCTDNSYDGENCYNVLRAYYRKIDVKNFAYWLILAKKYNKNNKSTMAFISEMEEKMQKEDGAGDFFK
ncbi:MAG: hypothetical protein LBB53_04350 [Prevotellaceae bacterium]|jgi:tetratricopeptide (TPR) repeat protein|nr:hypothetical protein [Prevotellaceae bacterium]